MKLSNTLLLGKIYGGEWNKRRVGIKPLFACALYILSKVFNYSYKCNYVFLIKFVKCKKLDKLFKSYKVILH